MNIRTQVKVKVLVAQSCPTLWDPMDCNPPDSFVHENFQVRILDWVAIPFFRGFFPTRESNLGLLHCSGLLTIWATWEALRTQGIPHFLPDNVYFSFKNEARCDWSEKHLFICPLLAELELPLCPSIPPLHDYGGTYYNVLLTNAAFFLPLWWVIWWKNLDFISFSVPSRVTAAEWVLIVTVCVCLCVCKRQEVGMVRGIWKSRRGEERRRWNEEKWRRKGRRKRRRNVRNGQVLWNYCEMNLVPYSINYLDPTSFPNKGSIGGILDPWVWASTHILCPIALKIYEYSPFLSDGSSSEWFQVFGANLRNPPDILVMLLQGPTFGTSGPYIWCYWVWGLVPTWRLGKGLRLHWGWWSELSPHSLLISFNYVPQAVFVLATLFPREHHSPRPNVHAIQAPPACHFNLAN